MTYNKPMQPDQPTRYVHDLASDAEHYLAE